jgi:hypothetical protein
LRDASTAASLGAPTDGEQTHRWPQISPGGKAVLFTGNISTTNFDNASIEALTLQTGQIKVLYPGGILAATFADEGGQGHWVYVHDGVLFGVPFDPDKLEARGTPSPLLEDVAADQTSESPGCNALRFAGHHIPKNLTRDQERRFSEGRLVCRHFAAHPARPATWQRWLPNSWC